MKRAVLWAGREEVDHEGDDTVAFYTSAPTLSDEECDACGRKGASFANKGRIDGSEECYSGWLKATKIALKNLEFVKISIGVEP